MATEETKPVEREAFEKYAKPRFSPECFNRSKATGQYFDGGVQNEYEAFVAGWDAALERAAAKIVCPRTLMCSDCKKNRDAILALKGSR